MSLQLSSMQSDCTKIFLQTNASDAKVIRELLSPWNVCFTEANEAEVSIVYRQKPAEAHASVIIPSNSTSFNSWTKSEQLNSQRKLGKLVSVPATEQTELPMTCGTWYCFDGSIRDGQEEFVDLAIEENCSLLKMDLIEEFRTILNQTLHAKQSVFHRVVTGLPIAYGLAPAALRKLVMRSNNGPENLALCQKLPIDTLRFALVNAIAKASGRELEKKPVFQNNYLCILTHDVESAQGLRRARVLKKIEEKYDMVCSFKQIQN
jgi:hypothetical protein